MARRRRREDRSAHSSIVADAAQAGSRLGRAIAPEYRRRARPRPANVEPPSPKLRSSKAAPPESTSRALKRARQFSLSADSGYSDGAEAERSPNAASTLRYRYRRRTGGAAMTSARSVPSGRSRTPGSARRAVAAKLAGEAVFGVVKSILASLVSACSASHIWRPCNAPWDARPPVAEPVDSDCRRQGKSLRRRRRRAGFPLAILQAPRRRGGGPRGRSGHRASIANREFPLLGGWCGRIGRSRGCRVPGPARAGRRTERPRGFDVRASAISTG